VRREIEWRGGGRVEGVDKKISRLTFYSQTFPHRPSTSYPVPCRTINPGSLRHSLSSQSASLCSLITSSLCPLPLPDLAKLVLLIVITFPKTCSIVRIVTVYSPTITIFIKRLMRSRAHMSRKQRDPIWKQVAIINHILNHFISD
jgi:hypothetical protein